MNARVGLFCGCARRTLVLVAILAHREMIAQTNQVIYSDSLQNSWQDWSWATVTSSSQPTHSGSSALAVTAGPWEALYLHRDALSAGTFTNLSFWVHGGSKGGQRIAVQATLSARPQAAVALPALAAGTWQQVSLSLSSLSVAGAGDFDGFWVADRTGTTQPTFYVDDIVLSGEPTAPVTNAEMIVVFDAMANRRPISDLIYGVAFAEAGELADLHSPLNRSGGNGETRYNWQLNAHNHGADWYFESLADSPATPGAAGDAFVEATQTGGATPMLTLSMIGWAPKLGSNRGRLASYSIKKYGPQTGSDAQWFPDAGNGVSVTNKQPIVWNDPNDANSAVGVNFQRGWMEHLTNRWGRAGQGKSRFYCMDNEPSIWHSTHRDVRPVGLKMQELRDLFLQHAAMAREVDPGALICAPEEWGWSGYFYSGYDQQYGAAHGWSDYPDRKANGDAEYLPWFLDQVRARDAATGTRSLDVFTVHFYPQGGEYGDDVSTAMQLRRNRSTRALWDPSYVDETWIGTQVRLIPRLREWVSLHYPGTRIGITEYNWGAEKHMNGATAQADVLGIFGHEGLDVGNRWTTPASGTPAYNAIRMYRNYDSAKSSFGDMSVLAQAPDPDRLSAFGALRSADGALTAMFIHKQLEGQQPVQVALTNFAHGGIAQVWQLAESKPIQHLSDLVATNGMFRTLLPPQSVTLLVVPPAETAPRLTIEPANGDSVAKVTLRGALGIRYLIQQSDDLRTWAAFLTNTMVDTGFPFFVPVNAAAAGYYRAMKLGE